MWRYRRSTRGMHRTGCEIGCTVIRVPLNRFNDEGIGSARCSLVPIRFRACCGKSARSFLKVVQNMPYTGTTVFGFNRGQSHLECNPNNLGAVDGTFPRKLTQMAGVPVEP